MFNSEHLQCFAITKDQLRQTLRIKDAKHFLCFFGFHTRAILEVQNQKLFYTRRYNLTNEIICKIPM